jgi:Fe2+ or Zn2+ uptake regulation protein
MERTTSQKEIILEHLKSVETHPSAETVYLSVKKKLPRISKGTVYRILKGLKEKGEIQEIPGEISRYDGKTSSHAHFFCEKCQKIFDVFEKYIILKDKKLNPIRFALQLSNGVKVGKIKNYQIYFYGCCKNCQKK